MKKAEAAKAASSAEETPADENKADEPGEEELEEDGWFLSAKIECLSQSFSYGLYYILATDDNIENWKMVKSKVLNKVFYYNTKNKIGQFSAPDVVSLVGELVSSGEEEDHLSEVSST